MSKEELQELVRNFRQTLGAIESGGVYSVSGEQSERPAVTEAEAGSEVAEVAEAEASQGSGLDQVREELGDCQRCPLAEGRQQIVFGDGSESAEIMFIGEAPGAEEDKQGLPFVGESGRLLDKMIVAMGWTRETVYIANVLKCRPPDNRDPRVAEVQACETFLAKQIQCVNPTVIVTLGKPAAHLLLKTSASMGSLRGRWQEYAGIPVMPTYHPAYLLREPARKRDVWADLQEVMRCFE